MGRFRFRVWNKEDETYEETTSFDCVRIDNDGQLHIYNYSDASETLEDYTDSYIIEQCTGLKDKNGNLIYEGDILLLHNNNFEVGHNGITVFFKCLTDEYIHIDPLDFDYNDSEIIGNIHEQKDNK